MMSRCLSLVMLLGSLSLLLEPSAAWADKPPRFVALLANGQRIEGNTLTEWHNNGAMPRIDGKPLLEPQAMLRWQRDRWLLPGALPKAFVEMHTGDRLPGTVFDFSQGTDAPFALQPPHFRVRPEFEIKPPQKEREPVIRVVASFVKRVVWQRRDRDDYQPSTLFYRDGRSVQFRAVRFGNGFANLLLSDGNRRVSFNEIAEIHLPAVSPWQAYFDELAALGLWGNESRLLQIDTNEGLILTSSTDRRQFHGGGGNAQEFQRWSHGLQPAWSLDEIYAATTGVWARRMWLPHEVPLSHITPTPIATRSPLSATGRAPQTNRNVQGGPLRAGQQDYGFGFGVQAQSELAFDLPEGVKALRGRVGLDKLAGRGGCVRARIFANSSSTSPLWESPYLVGSEVDADLGTIGLAGPAQGQKQLILQVDIAHQGRPGGADPLDVRDTADWLDPILELDPIVVQQEVLKRRLKQPVAWRDWTPAQAPSGTTQVINYWNELNGSPGDYRLTMAAREKPIVLSREIKLSPSDNWLVVFANRYPSGGPAAKLEVRIGGEPVAEYEVPFRHRGNEDQPPLAISLANYRNAQKPIQVEIRQTATTHEGYVDWRSIQVVDQLPHLYQAFEDHGVFTAIDGDQKGIAKLITDDHHYGSHAVQVTPDGQFRLTFPKPIAIRERPQWGEYRHLRFAFRKVGEGRLALEVNRVGDALKPARYDAGAGEKVLESALRLWNDKLPNQWIVMTRDLYNDFGAFDATGLTITAPDGQQALFDHVYLARSNEDFKLIPNAPPPELTNQMARRDLAKPVLDRGFPAVVVIETNDGRFGSGVSLSQQGEILTAGHLLANANLPCTVHFADGRKVKAQTRGIYRDLDVGLIKVTDPGDYPFIERGNARDLPEQQLYVGFAHPLKLAAGVKPAAHIVGLRRVFRGMIWTDFDLPDYSSGGPLLNREAKLMGILAKRSEFGGFLFARLEDFDGQLGRLRNGEVYGAWYPGLGPMFGINVQSTRDGAKVLDVFPNSPAASANLKSGDIVTKVDGRAVVSLEDIYAVLGEKNAGQEAQIEYSRSGQAQQTKLLLVPRTP